MIVIAIFLIIVMLTLVTLTYVGIMFYIRRFPHHDYAFVTAAIYTLFVAELCVGVILFKVVLAIYHEGA